MTISFIGLGLIGGSIAKALKAACPDIQIKVYDKDIPSMTSALREHIAASIHTELTQDLCNADIIFLCAPVSVNEEHLKKIAPMLQPHTIVTDVGSVKGTIHSLVTQLHLDTQFIGGHPMTGSERFGYANSKASLLENAYYILTPAQKVTPEKVLLLKELVLSVKAIPLIIACTEHDHATAAISHLPHIIASALVNVVKEADSKEGLMKTLAAGGFKDITRIASANPVMWQQICLTNTENIKELLNQYIAKLTHISAALEQKDALTLYDFFEEARLYRDSFSTASIGPIKPTFTIHIEICDKPGSIAEITALLAQHNLNIKNMNITHNRETEYGALMVEFYSDKDMLKAVEILQKGHFTTYLKKI